MSLSCFSRGVAPEEPGRRHAGLRNQGATCHLNTVLQALYMTPELRTQLTGLTPSDLPPVGKSLVGLFARMGQDNVRTASTKALTSALRPGYVCTRQQDCHDTWLYLSDRLEADLRATKHCHLLSDLFEGRQCDYVRCHACGTTTRTVDTFSNLSLAVPSADAPTTPRTEEKRESDGEEEREAGAGAKPAGKAVAEASSGGSSDRAGAHNILRALRDSLKPEQLDGDDQFECDKCQVRRAHSLTPHTSHKPIALSLRPRPSLCSRVPFRSASAMRSAAFVIARCLLSSRST